MIAKRQNERGKRLSATAFIFLFFVVIFSLYAVGCQPKEDDTKKTDLVNPYYIYYLDNKGTRLVREPYNPKGKTVSEQLSEYKQALEEKKPADLTFKKALPDYIKMSLDNKIENEQLTILFDSSYLKLTGASEVLCRAAIVKTFCQIEGIEYVEFEVDGQPLKDSNDVPIGFMKAEDFIDNTGGETKYEQNAAVILYFADESGKKLVETRVKINYNGTVRLDQLMMTQLIKGPKSIEGVNGDEIFPTLSAKTRLNKAVIKDGICYVDFNEEFLKGMEGVKSKITIYSVVNTLVEIPEVNKVQVTVNGSKINSYGDGVNLEAPIERNLDLVVKTK